MEITPQQKKTLIVIVIIIVVLVALLFLARFFSIYLSTRVVPEISESIVGGKLLGSKITSGTHTLEFRAKTTDGKVVSDQVVFSASTNSENPETKFIQHVVYSNSQSTKYATNNSGKWEISTIDSGASTGKPVSIFVDQNKKIHIAYANNGLKYATNLAGTWASATVDPSAKPATMTNVSVVVDQRGAIHIIYDDGVTTSHGRTIKYATNSSGQWQTHGLALDDWAGMSGASALAIDPQGTLHVAFLYKGKTPEETGPGVKKIFYMQNATGTLAGFGESSEIVVASEDIGDSIAIIGDKNGKAHIAYFDTSRQHLLYATNTSGNWVNNDIAANAAEQGNDFMTLDQSNKIYIGYYNTRTKDLNIATNASGNWATHYMADPLEDDGKNSALIIDTQGKLHIASIDATRKTLEYHNTDTSSFSRFDGESIEVLTSPEIPLSIDASKL